MVHVIWLCKKEHGRWVGKVVAKLHGDATSGHFYLSEDYMIEVSYGFTTEANASAHIFSPLCYPDNVSASKFVNASNDLPGWTYFFNPVSGINNPDNAITIQSIPTLDECIELIERK